MLRTSLEALMTEKDVAGITGMSLASVRRWRLLRQGGPVDQDRRGGAL